jgi:uncharacterized repeat protein (TIGR01451 family)
MNAHSVAYRILLLIIALTLALSIMALPTRTSQAMASGISDFYVPTSSGQIMAIFIDNDNTNSSGGVLIDQNLGIHYVIGLTAYMDNTVVYYDHWENGYNFNPVTLTGADEAYSGNQGDVLNFISYSVPISRSPAPGETIAECDPRSSNPSGTTTNCYDGRDHLFITGGAAATLTVWPESVGTAYALSWALYPTKPFETNHTIPVGKNLAGSPSYYLDFTKTYVIVQSTEDGNLVTIDDPETGGVEVSVTLNKGEVTQLYSIWSGTTVTATYPVQTLYLAGEFHGTGDGALELRGYTSIPTNLWTNEYFNPVNGRTGGNSTDLYIYNPGSAQTVNWQDLTGSGSFSISAGGTLAYSDALAANHKVPNDSGVRLTAVNKFNVIGAADTEAGSYEWGFNLIPSNLLADEYYLGWAPGTTDSPAGHNCSPVWVTATQNNTSISVDYSPVDGTYDGTYILDQLESIRIYDPDHDNTGMNLVANGSFAAAWGEAGIDEDGVACSSGTSNLDLGYTVVPYLDEYSEIVLNLDKTSDPSLILNQAGQQVEFTLVVSTDEDEVRYVDVVDLLPASWQYVDDSTTITFPDDSTLSGNDADPTSIVGQHMTWDLNARIPAHKTLTIVYKAVTTTPPGGISINKATATGELGTRVFTAMGNAAVNISDIQMVKDSNVTGLVKAGDLIDYTLTLTNASLLPHNQIVVRDPLPAGTSYVANSTVASGKVLGTYLDQFAVRAYNNSNGTFPWSSSWNEGGAESGNNPINGLIQITSGTGLLQFHDTGTPPRDYSLTRVANISGATRATLSFTYSEAGTLESADAFHVDVSDGSTWHTVLTMSDDFTGPFTASYNISGWTNANTQVRFVANGYGDTGEYLYLDNVSIQFDKTTTKDNITGGTYSDLLNGIPENLVVNGDAFTLPGGGTMTVTYRVQVKSPLDLGLMSIANEAYSSNADDPRESKGSVADALDVIDVSLEGALSDVTPEIGSTVTFTLTVANPAGFQAANNLTVTDIVPTGFTYLPGTITGGTSRNDSNPTGTGLTWTIASLAADSNAVLTYQATTLGSGMYDNYVEITAYNQYDFDSRAGNGQQSPDEDDDVTILIELIAAPALNVTTITDLSEVDGAGDVINYTVSVENIGNVRLAGITVNDPDVSYTYLSGDTNLDGWLDITETWVYTGSYVVTQAEMDAGGTIHSVVTADSVESPPDTTVNDVSIIQNPELNVTTSTDVTDVDSVGDVIHYTVSVYNTGNTSLTGVIVNDLDVNLTYQSGDTDLDGELDVTEIWVYAGSYTVTQADMDAGGTIHTMVTADTNESQLDTFETDITISTNPEFNVTTTTDVTEVDGAGDVIVYTVRVENTGDASLHNITVNDPDLTLTYQSGDSDLDGVLDVTETWIYTGSYTITQAEMDAGGMIHSVVTATSTDIPSDTYAMDVTIVQTPDILITLSADPTSVDEAGDVIDYTLTVENTGNLTLTGITLVDTPDLTWTLTGDTDLDGNLDVGETWTYSASHTVTQAEINAGDPIHLQTDVDSVQTGLETGAVDVLVVNAIPVTVEDSYDLHWSDTGLNITADIGVLANDSDANFNPLSVELVSGVTNGILDLEVDGAFTYTPTPGYYGPGDSFTYRVFDGLDYSDQATVTINFTNTLPAGLADEYSTTVNLTLSMNASTGLLHNDGDADGDPITVELVTGPAPAEGSLDELNSDGSFTFTPADGFTGDATFTYRLHDGLEYSDPIMVTIHVGSPRYFLPIIRRPAIYKYFLPINVRE